MSSIWQDFLKTFDNLLPQAGPKPGKVMVVFLNRYQHGVPDLKVRFVADGKPSEHKTSEANYAFELAPHTLQAIEVWVWSNKRGAYKRLNDVMPAVGLRVLEKKIINTVLIKGQTRPFEEPAKYQPAKLTPPAPSGPSPKDKQGVDVKPSKDESGLPIDQAKRPVPEGITADQLAKVFTQADKAYLQQVADELNTDLKKYKLDTVFRRAHFFGQIRQESGAKMSPEQESFNYLPAGLIATFGYYQKHKDEAQQDGRIVEDQVVNEPEFSMKLGKTIYKQVKTKVTVQKANQEVIANKVYGPEPGKAQALGNNKDYLGDGWKYRGRGLKQMTGKWNYEQFQNGYVDLWSESKSFLDNPDLLLQFPYSLRSAVWFWISKNCYVQADGGIDDDDIDAVTKIVNSGEIEARKKARRQFTKDAYYAFI